MKVLLKIEGMTCSACSSGLEKYLNKQEHILDAHVNLVMSSAEVTYEAPLKIEDLNRFVKEAGFVSLGEFDPLKEEKQSKVYKGIVITMGIIALILMYISMGHMLKLPEIPIFNMENHPKVYSITLMSITILFLIYGFDILISGIKCLFHRHPNMDTLVSLGVLSTFIYSVYGTIMIIKGNYDHVHNLYFESAAMVIYFVKLGRLIDRLSKDKTKEAIKDLVTITPDKALKLVDGKETVITLDMIKKKDILISKPGTKIAVDGTIKSGTCHLDEAFISGESIPVKKSVGDKVIAGSINYDGYIEYSAEKIGKESTISNIVKLVLEATNSKTKISLIADKISGIFVPLVMIIAIISVIVNLILHKSPNEIINTFVSVLVVACPCALGLATPLAIVVSEGVSAKKGILIKSSETIELINKLDTVVFDKTGTITYGNLKVNRIYNYSDSPDHKILSKVCSIEKKSLHPISNAFKEYSDENELKEYEVDKFESMDGYGIKANIEDEEIYIGGEKLLTKLKIKNTHKEDEKELTNNASSLVYVIINKKLVALIGVRDSIKSEAKGTISKLIKLNKNVIMLTGDNEQTAKVIADKVGIKNIIANVLPSEKNDKIKELQKDNKIVMMVGDGINDAPSLATANIGVSLSTGTDIANNSSDVIILNDDLSKIIDLINISEKTIKNIKQNLFWAFFYNSLMLPIALGLLSKWHIHITPMVAAFAMTISSLTVIFNALRLRIPLKERDEYHVWKKRKEES